MRYICTFFFLQIMPFFVKAGLWFLKKIILCNNGVETNYQQNILVQVSRQTL